MSNYDKATFIDNYESDSLYAIDQENKDHSNSCNKPDNHNLFLQAFEKPTQIYRYLRTRHVMSPIFIHRTLSYMKHRLRRSKSTRKDFKVDSILQKVLDKKKEESSNDSKFENLVIVGLGIFDKKFVDPKTTATLELSLIKLCHKRRKDAIAPISSILIGKCDLPVNPSDRPSNTVALTVSKANLSTTNAHPVKCYSLQFKVTCHSCQTVNGELQNDINNSDNCELPSYKRRRVQIKTDYERELRVIDKHQTCLLTNGEYQIVLSESSKAANNSSFHSLYSNKHSNWDTIGRRKSNTSLIFEKGPVLVFNLFWSNSNLGHSQDVGNLLKNSKLASYHHHNHNHQAHHNNHYGNAENNSITFNGVTNNCNLLKRNGFVHFNNNSVSSEPQGTSLNSRQKNSKIIYRFLYNNVVIQQTKCSNDLKCPWCSLKCLVLSSLLKHLRLCHNRFHFTHVTDVRGHKIDVTINENFDGSYSGNPHDLSHATTGYAFSKNGPVRRFPVTQIIFIKPRKYCHSSLFASCEDADCTISMRPYTSGHNRLYFQSTDCFPIKPDIIDEDSESENDPEWMRVKTQLMIDEFTDVNEGEKEVMKLWNLHGMKHGFVGDCQIALACSKFVDNYGQEIINRNLYRNFILHLNNLFDFGVLSATAMRTTIRKLHQLENQYLKKKEESK